MRYRTPGGQYWKLFRDMAEQPHLLIAGATGSGKSVVVNGIVSTLLTCCNPSRAGLILIDPKRVELVQYKQLPHTLCYASEPGEFEQALRMAMEICDSRYKNLQARALRKWDGGDVYVVIDELADLITTNKKECQPLIQRISQVGRGAKIHLIVCTQTPVASILSTPIKCNIDARVGLRCRSGQDSRNILGVTGCEKLPRVGKAYYMTPEGINLWNIPYVTDAEINELVRYWTSEACVA